MISEEMNALEKALIAREDMRFPEAATETDISSFEKNNDTALPASFKEWLLLHDGGEFYLPGGVQIYGVANKPFINVKDKDRPNEDYIVIGRMSWGEPVVFQKGKEEIAIYDHETGAIDDDVRYESFLAFLKGLYDLLGIEE